MGRSCWRSRDGAQHFDELGEIQGFGDETVGMPSVGADDILLGSRGGQDHHWDAHQLGIGLDDAFAQRQANAGARVFGMGVQSLEDLEDPQVLFGINADAVVGHREMPVLALPHRRDVDARPDRGPESAQHLAWPACASESQRSGIAIQYKGKVAVFRDQVGVDEAETLLEWLQKSPSAKVDLAACTHLHPANLQVLMAAGAHVSGWPVAQELRTWLEPALKP